MFELTESELKRYNRQVILPELGIKGQKKLKGASVLVVGAGGLGCPVLLYLTGAGIGKIGICDFDFVDETNLQRQVLYTMKDLGKPKAVVAAKRLSKLNPLIHFQPHNLILKKQNALELFKLYDLIVDASDNFPTRFLINDACVVLNKPFVFGAVYKFEGQVSVFNYMNGPTYRCLVPEMPKQSGKISCSETGVMGILTGITGTYQAMEVVKIISGIGKVLSGELLHIDAFRMEHKIISIKRNRNTAKRSELEDDEEFCNFRDLEIVQLRPDELAKMMKNAAVAVIDIRPKELFDMYHIKSKNMGIDQIFNHPEKLPEDKKIVFVCEHGINSNYVSSELKKKMPGMAIYNLQGGLQAWIRDKLPVIEPKKSINPE